MDPLHDRSDQSRPRFILDLYSPMERALLAAFLRVPDPQPCDLTGIDVTRPIPRRWSERRDGIGPRLSELDSNSLMLENAIARICLESISDQLPQWAVVHDGDVTLARPRRRVARRLRALSPVHLFTLNWADSGPGFSWPEAYYVTSLPGYDVAIVTASADSPDTNGYCDIAVGWYPGDARDLRKAGDCIIAHWRKLAECCQERWEYLFDTGAFDEREAKGLAEAVWPASGGRE